MFYRMDRALLLVGVALVISLGACHKKPPKKPDYYHELGPGEKALRKISPAEYPDFSQCGWNLGTLPRSIDASLHYMAHPSSQRFFPYLDIGHERAISSLRAFRQLVADAATQPNPGAYIDQQIRANFEVYKSIGAPNPEGPGYTDRVLFTGYCTPDREASLTRSGPYQYPIYKRPKDLAVDSATGETAGRLTAEGAVVPYYTRAQIEGQNVLAGNELAFLKSRWEAYIVTVQGSARLKLPDGRIMEVGFHGHNGYEYTSPGKQMVADGVITREQLNLRTLGAYFAANPQAMDQYLWLNKRTVFFTERPGGPFGMLNVPVTPFATIATDKEVYPRAMPAFLAVPIPRSDNPSTTWPFRGFMLDQDSGGAIRAAGRCDIYMGIGDQAEDLAGHQLNEGELYYIALKPELMQNYATPTPPEQLKAATRPSAGK